ncbi:MAG: hypothetical protein ABMA64_16220 [Myxococcota bacterium]
MNRFSEKVSFIWSVADLLRGDFKAQRRVLEVYERLRADGLKAAP